MASVKVAVRVRPLNQRELELDSLPIIEMDGKRTRITNNKIVSMKEGDASRENYKDFTFDHSYWSFNPKDDHFVSQEQVFKDLGMDVVRNAFEGYNVCIFAYGQTGSGKTHTMMGTPSNLEQQGLIPRICKAMFNRMSEGKVKGTTYRTEVSYLEIYNERVKDLLKKDQTHNLRVREHPKHGPYVEELSKHLVMDYPDIESIMSRGNSNRTTASTNMNDTSSRSHAIFTMSFVQASFIGDLPSETVSKIHLVDLAGSERADASGATGVRLKEGGHINKSLVTLGSVISALAEFSTSQKQNRSKQVFIPYRDSVLTWLLKDSLGGNSKTIMIATISPADCNHGETLSTLRYANRAKNIINKPTINEDSNVKLIKELREEINKLRSLLTTNVKNPDVIEELHKKEAKEKVLTKEWEEKWKETQKILMEQKDLALRKAKAGTGVILDSQMPHLIGIDDDLLSTGITLYHLREGTTKIGSDDSEDRHDITLKGLGLEPQHCSISLVGGVATLIPTEGAVCTVNGLSVKSPMRLTQGCVILLGRTNMFRYNDPQEVDKLRKEGSYASHMNLNRLSFMSRSNTDLAWSSENLIPNSNGEENNILEEKRRLLEAEELRIQNESRKLLSQKALLEEQINNYQQLQQEKEENWKSTNKSLSIGEAPKDFESDINLHKIMNDLSTADLKRLIDQINEQKKVVLECLENDTDKEEMNHQMTILQDLRNRYLELEIALGRNSKARWFTDYEDSSFEFDRGDEELTPGSEMDDSEIQSNITEITEHDDQQLQLIVEQRVEKRLREIISHLHSGKSLAQILGTKSNFGPKMNRRSLPGGLDAYSSGSDDDLSSNSPQHLPRSVSLNSGLCPPMNGDEALIPGILDISIPKYIVRGSGNYTHYQYEINIITATERWTVYRRFSRFREFYQTMRKKYGPRLGALQFPSRKFFGSKTERLASERRPQLEMFIRSLIRKCVTFPNCSLYNVRPEDAKSALIQFSNFFEKGLFETTIYGTS